jgi:WD40 repeat protein
MVRQPMPLSEPLRIFISYARKDGAVLAQRLQSDLMTEGFDAWLDTQRIGGGRVWSMQLENQIDTRQVMLALLSPSSYVSEICRAEQLRALDQGKRVIPVLAVKGADRPVYLYARQCRDFTEEAHYSVRLAELSADILSDATATLADTCRKTRVTYLTAPARVANYMERPEALQALRDALFAEDHRQAIALTALAGMGGIGKTVLAKALTDDEVVQRAFPDGIVWITAGKERKRDFIEEMREVAKALGDDLSGYDATLACENQYRTTIANKAALIVVDDVWSKADIEPLLAESRRSRFLFTTRDASIGRFVGAHEHRADLPDTAQSRELLASWANRPVAELPAAADDVIAECGRLPLALSVVGAMLCGTDAEFWRDTLDLLRKADLSAIQQQLPEGQDSFFKAVEVSFQSLKPELQQRYKTLAVLLEDMAAPLSILQTLWKVDRPEARRISRNLVDRSLAQPDDAGESIRLHDLQLDYVRAQYPPEEKEAFDLIHGAVRLSAHVIGKDPQQFASQMVGRLLACTELPAIERFTERIVAGAATPWLRPLQPALHPPGTGLVLTLEGHTDDVNGVALTPDGQWVVSASRDKTLKVWDLASGRELRTVTCHTNYIWAVAVTRDGQRAVSVSSDPTLKVWELGTGRELYTLTGHTNGIIAVAVTPDGKRAISGSWDHTLKVWDLDSGRELRTLTGHSDSVEAVAVTPDGQQAVSASRDNTLKVWDLGSGRELRTLKGHKLGVTAVAVTPNGQRVLSASSDKTLKVWDLDSGRELRTLAGHFEGVSGVAVTPDGRRAVSASRDDTLRVWELESGRELRTLKGHASIVNAATVTPDGQRVVSASNDGTLKVWELHSGRELRTRRGHFEWVSGVAVTPDGRRAVSASGDQKLKVWDLGSGRQLGTMTGHSDFVLAVAVTPDGQRVVSASSDKTLKVWEVESGRELRTLTGHTSSVHAVTVTPDGQWAVSGSWEELKVWELESGRELRTLTGHSHEVSEVAVTPDGMLAVSASRDATLKVWELESGRELRTLAGHAGPVWAVAVTPDGQRAVSAAWQELKVWDLGSGRELFNLTGHAASVWAVAVTPDGYRAVSASGDKTIKVWDLETRVLLATFTCDASAQCCAFSGALKLIVAGDAGGFLHLLRLEEPKREI